MHYLICILISSTLVVPTYGQTVPSYKAINGITYHVGDTVQINIGSLPDKSFQFIRTTGALALLLDDDGNDRLSPNAANSKLVIKKIKEQKNRTSVENKTILVLASPSTVKVILNCFIDQAIKACEVTPCNTD